MSKCKEGALELLLPAKTFIERLYNKSSSNKNTWKTKFTQHEITCRYKKKKKSNQRNSKQSGRGADAGGEEFPTTNESPKKLL